MGVSKLGMLKRTRVTRNSFALCFSKLHSMFSYIYDISVATLSFCVICIFREKQWYHDKFLMIRTLCYRWWSRPLLLHQSQVNAICVDNIGPLTARYTQPLQLSRLRAIYTALLIHEQTDWTLMLDGANCAANKQQSWRDKRSVLIQFNLVFVRCWRLPCYSPVSWLPH